MRRLYRVRVYRALTLVWLTLVPTSALAQASIAGGATVGVDIFNLMNSDTVLTFNQTFVPGGTWLAPLSVLTPRFVKIGAQIEF